jgi:hypothetical protein
LGRRGLRRRGSGTEQRRGAKISSAQAPRAMKGGRCVAKRGGRARAFVERPEVYLTRHTRRARTPVEEEQKPNRFFGTNKKDRARQTKTLRRKNAQVSLVRETHIKQGVCWFRLSGGKQQRRTNIRGGGRETTRRGCVSRGRLLLLGAGGVCCVCT